MTRVDNRNAGARTRAAQVIVPAVLLVLGTTGVVARPTLGLEAARRQRVEAESREREYEHECARAEAFERSGGLAHVEAATRAVQALVPEALSALELQSVVVLLARRDHVDLQTLEVGEPLETGFDRIDDRIVAVDVTLRAAATLVDVVRFCEDTRSLGLAVCIKECRLARTRPGDRRIELQMTLSFHHRAEPLAAASEDTAGGT